MEVQGTEVDPLERIKAAFHAGHAGTVRRILEENPELKARINEPVGDFGSPPILHASTPELVDALVDSGADINVKSDWWAGGFGILHSASPEVAAHAIARGAKIDAHAAARLGMMEELREIVARNPEVVHERGGDGQTPLHFARTVEIAEFLLENGANIDARDLDHESTPAQWMLDERQDVARYLVSRGCWTDILMAAALGDVELTRKILDSDPDSVRKCVSDEYFPMIGGSTGGTMYQWKLGWYATPHVVARKFGREEVYALLMERSPVEVKLLNSCLLRDEAAARNLLAADSGLASRLTESERRHAAHAARNNDLEVLKLLLECGFSVDATSQHKATALHWAGFHGNEEMARILLGYDPPLEVKDADFDGTPLSWAIYGSEHGWYRGSGDYAGTVAALLGAGAVLPGSYAGTAAVREVIRKWEDSSS